ncbi:protein phtf [Anthonomus grandis grandis]|uniref:protein phtf n=1 Tax=Anthonomus grandis grandis TaxID=2921223 RepID=UPI00216544F3|nr:protein phtf [Anthonomus grandis grandis]
MGIEELFVWYQQKIGTYDKQLWETRIEQREQRFYGLNHVQMRTAKLNTDLIDLDLVRGSSFTKAKPQHGILKVTRLATVRSIFMPLYAKWWIHQTSVKFFTFLLFLYSMQFFNIVMFYMYSSSSSEGLSCMEVAVPVIMAWLLSLIHSQIVATIPDKQDNRRRTRKKLQFADDIKSDIKNRRRFSTKNNPFNLHFSSYAIRRKYRLNLRPWFRRVTVDDDGFESLVGNGSRTSEEDIVSNELVQPIEVLNLGNTSTPKEFKEKTASSPPLPTEKILIEEITENITSTTSGPAPACVLCKRGSQDQGLEGEEASNCPSCLKCKNWVKQLKGSVKSACCTDSDSEGDEVYSKFSKKSISKRRVAAQELPTIAVTSAVDSTCDTENEALSSPRDWTAGVTTNSEDCSSDLDDVSDAAPADRCSDCFVVDGDANAFLTPPSVKASCTIYERDEIKKADLSMLDISSIIISKVEATPSTPDYFYAGIVVASFITILPLLCRVSEEEAYVRTFWETCKNGTFMFINSGSATDAIFVAADQLSKRIVEFADVALAESGWERCIVAVAMIQRFILACMVFFLLAIAERTFKQRLLYAKLFSHLTSSRRARKSEIPHFRLNKVRNIKTWLSVRSYLKKRGPQRSVDVIVSTTFVVTLLLLAFLCAEILKETVSFSQYYLEALIWCVALGVMLLRFITLGTKINKKYRNLSVLITEQINLHLQIEQKPHKKDELTVANNVLKLAIDLLKELENPFKISGLSANPILYNVIKLVILSALSGVLSEMLGFKLKLHKIKLK